MIRYAITDGLGAVAAGVDLVQLRDKSADAGELEKRARRLLAGIGGARLLVNGRVDVAMVVRAAGVHLTATVDELTVAQVKRLMADAVVSVSCHTLAEVERARAGGADWILFGPVFEKRVDGQVVVGGVGLGVLRAACGLAPGRVLALGGVTEGNAGECVEAGAAGVAGIRMFGA